MTALQPITIETIVAATPEEAWAAYNSPEAITQWNQASEDWHCPSASVDLRAGGRYVARMEAKDGSFGFDFGGTYEEVNEPHALALVMDEGRRMRTTFAAEGSGTRVTTIFDPEAMNPLDMQRDGWQSILDSYARYVSKVAAR